MNCWLLSLAASRMGKGNNSAHLEKWFMAIRRYLFQPLSLIVVPAHLLQIFPLERPHLYCTSSASIFFGGPFAGSAPSFCIPVKTTPGESLPNSVQRFVHSQVSSSCCVVKSTKHLTSSEVGVARCAYHSWRLPNMEQAGHHAGTGYPIETNGSHCFLTVSGHHGPRWLMPSTIHLTTGPMSGSCCFQQIIIGPWKLIHLSLRLKQPWGLTALPLFPF